MKWWTRVSVLVLVAAVAEIAQPASNPPSPRLAESEATSIRVVLEHYRQAWLANDADGVRGVFTQDAILMPHHGLVPVTGMAAINEFWFPSTTAKTTVDKFVQTIDEVGGNENLAYLRGQSEVAWTIRDKGQSQSWHTHGNFLALLKKQSDGRWLISHLIWDDVPNERLD